MGVGLSEILKGKQSVALGGHIRPDGDCVGSSMGLYLYLTEQYPQIETDVFLEEIP
ncbi:MAG: DHH family phosphoesterase, partial [Clostridium sp.]|nr:DHH family phosphoesterase [Clostridium sp.]